MNRAAYTQLINTVGIPMEFRQAKAPAAVVPIAKAGIATAKADAQVVNAYGAGSRVVTILQTSLPGIVPEQFDSVVINGVEVLVFDAVLPAHEPGSGAVIGWRCMVRGK